MSDLLRDAEAGRTRDARKQGPEYRGLVELLSSERTGRVFGTILHDIFTSSERNALVTALNDLCAPDDQYGWASVGIYAFYDADEQKSAGLNSLLYLGLARDLSYRLGQHLGLHLCQKNGCKRVQVDSWFSGHDRLGFSCFVQSRLAQVNIHRERNALRVQYDEEAPGGFIDNPPHGLESTVRLEGQAIESYRIATGSLPPWNKIGGSIAGALRAPTGSGRALIRLMIGADQTLFRARRTIRELSKDICAAEYEHNVLHTARMVALQHFPHGASTTEVLSTIDFLAANQHYQRAGFALAAEKMRQAGYLSDLTHAQ